MSKIREAFKNGKAFIPFLTAGDPSLDKTAEFIQELERAGADLIEIGIPFSDPIAEGPVIQEADLRALAGAATTDKVFDMVRDVRDKVKIPLVFMTYLNPVFHYGYEKFFARCRECGLDGIIIPDLPFEEREELLETANRNGIEVISLIAPTSKERIRMIAREAQGFIYLVSSMGVTGMRNEICTDLEGMIREIRAVTDTPVAVGFGIHTPEQARDIAAMADGVIVGSAIVRMIGQYKGHAGKDIYAYTGMMKAAMEDGSLLLST